MVQSLINDLNISCNISKDTYQINLDHYKGTKALEIWNEFKNNVAVALLFLFIGFGSGLLTYKYISDIFNADVVLKNSYIYKTDLNQNYIHKDEFKYAMEEIKSLESSVLNLKTENSQLRESLSGFSNLICKQYAKEANSIIVEQRGIEQSIQNALSIYNGLGYKSEQNLSADKDKSVELRKYSAQLNEQLIQLREKISKCVK